jgi:hypothetical protein
MTVDLASSRMGRSWLKTEIDDIKRYNPQPAVGPACFQHDRGFGFQPNVSSNRRLSMATKQISGLREDTRSVVQTGDPWIISNVRFYLRELLRATYKMIE